MSASSFMPFIQNTALYTPLMCECGDSDLDTHTSASRLFHALYSEHSFKHASDVWVWWISFGHSHVCKLFYALYSEHSFTHASDVWVWWLSFGHITSAACSWSLYKTHLHTRLWCVRVVNKVWTLSSRQVVSCPRFVQSTHLHHILIWSGVKQKMNKIWLW